MTASNGNEGNVQYLRAALSEEIVHANLLRALTGGASPAGDPVQTFYLPAAAFSNLGTFLAVLNALGGGVDAVPGGGRRLVGILARDSAGGRSGDHRTGYGRTPSRARAYSRF
ncbi:MAG TPA: hypothetical protein VG456_04355 [Candidatus Sulfopaludibacter sp.]|jgi:hypothetical protein|nr:hypothetical protein [Candidatus Sulfopaludibacter sp.]